MMMIGYLHMEVFRKGKRLDLTCGIRDFFRLLGQLSPARLPVSWSVHHIHILFWWVL